MSAQKSSSCRGPCFTDLGAEWRELRCCSPMRRGFLGCGWEVYLLSHVASAPLLLEGRVLTRSSLATRLAGSESSTLAWENGKCHVD